MNTIISMQDIRISLAAIADRVQKGERFTVVRNSRPAFRIVPYGEYPEAADESIATRSVLTVRELQDRLSKTPAAREVTARDIDDAIREVRRAKRP